MKSEIKVRIEDLKLAEDQIVSRGAKFSKVATTRFTYFNQPIGKVLKISETKKGAFKVVIENDGDNFNFISSEKIDDLDKTLDELRKQFGLKKKLTIERRIFKYKNFSVSVNEIRGVGKFLIVTGDKPSTEVVEELGFKNPEIIKESFDNL